jgi:hypothetical protein
MICHVHARGMVNGDGHRTGTNPRASHTKSARSGLIGQGRFCMYSPDVHIIPIWGRRGGEWEWIRLTLAQGAD